MTIHPLTPRRPLALARIIGMLAGIATFVTAAVLMIEVVPPVAWLPHLDAPRTADLRFFIELITTLVSQSGPTADVLGRIVGLLSLPLSMADALAYLGIDVSIAIRGTAALLAAGLIGSAVHAAMRSAVLAQPDVQHIKGPQLLSGAAARRGLAARWACRFGTSDPGVELTDSLVMPRELESEHFLVVGGTGAGKTTVLETLMNGALIKGDRMLALDVKGDVTARLPTENFCLLALDDIRSSKWVIGLDIRTSEDAAELAAELIPDTSDPSWSGGARQILAALIEYLQTQSARHGKTWSWKHLHRLLAKPVSDLHALLVESHPAAASLIDMTKDETRKQAMSFYIVLIANAGHLVKSCARLGDSSRKTLSIRRWAEGRNGQVLVLRQSQRQPELSAAMVRIALKIVADTIATPAATTGRTPTWLFLDELPQIGHSPAIPRLAAIGRSAGVRIVAAIQSPAQLREIYGDEGSQHLLDNLTTKIIGRVASGHTATDIASKWIGPRTVSWWEERGFDNNGKPRRECRTEDIPVVEPEFLTNQLGLSVTISSRRVIHALVIGHGDVAMLAWPVGRWPEHRPPVQTVARRINPPPLSAERHQRAPIPET